MNAHFTGDPRWHWHIFQPILCVPKTLNDLPYHMTDIDWITHDDPPFAFNARGGYWKASLPLSDGWLVAASP